MVSKETNDDQVPMDSSTSNQPSQPAAKTAIDASPSSSDPNLVSVKTLQLCEDSLDLM